MKFDFPCSVISRSRSDSRHSHLHFACGVNSLYATSKIECIFLIDRIVYWIEPRWQKVFECILHQFVIQITFSTFQFLHCWLVIRARDSFAFHNPIQVDTRKFKIKSGHILQIVWKTNYEIVYCRWGLKFQANFSIALEESKGIDGNGQN